MINAQLVAAAIASFATQIKSMFSKQLSMDAVMVVTHRVTGGGGSLISGSWQRRPLNSTERNTISGASLSVNQITLPPGDYYCEFMASAFAVNNVVTRLQNITNATELLLSDVGFSSSSSMNVNTKMNALGYFSLSVESILELQSQSTTTKNTDGLGMAFGNSESVHTKMVIYKVG